jgi:hypothetical protein
MLLHQQYLVDGVRVLKPALILNAKYSSILGRATDDKKRSDGMDIQFLLWWCTTNRHYPAAIEVPYATKQFVQWFIEVNGRESYGQKGVTTSTKVNFLKE